MFASFFLSVKITLSFWHNSWMSVVSSAWLTSRGINSWFTCISYTMLNQKAVLLLYSHVLQGELALIYLIWVPILCDPINILRTLQDVTWCFTIKQEVQNGIHSFCNCQENPKSQVWSLHLIPAEGTDDFWPIWSSLLLDIDPRDIPSILLVPYTQQDLQCCRTNFSSL